MAITHKYTILCDDVRQENTGKYIIIGVYTPGITVAQLPFALPALTFFTALEIDSNTTVKFSFRLVHGGATIGGGSGQMSSVPGLGILPIRLAPVVFQASGDYSFVLEIEGVETITHDFPVALQVVSLGNPTKAGVH